MADAWSKNWERIADDREATDKLIEEIDLIRKEIRLVLSNLS